MTEPADYSLGLIADLLGSGTAFAGMPRSELMAIVSEMSMREFRQGDEMAREGAKNSGHLMLIVKGEAQISTSYITDGSTLVYRRARAGHIMGEVGFIDGQPHSASVTAVTDMHVAILERAHLATLMATSPLAAAQLMAALLKLMAQRIRHANQTMRDQNFVKRHFQKENDHLQQENKRLQNALLMTRDASVTRS